MNPYDIWLTEFITEFHKKYERLPVFAEILEAKKRAEKEAQVKMESWEDSAWREKR